MKNKHYICHCRRRTEVISHWLVSEVSFFRPRRDGPGGFSFPVADAPIWGLFYGHKRPGRQIIRPGISRPKYAAKRKINFFVKKFAKSFGNLIFCCTFVSGSRKNTTARAGSR